MYFFNVVANVNRIKAAIIYFNVIFLSLILGIMLTLIQRYYIIDVYEIHRKILFNVKSVKRHLWKTSLCKYFAHL